MNPRASICLPLLLVSPSLAQTTIDRAEYADHLRAMWLGECIANWTGLRTEGARNTPPFFTDADWGTTPPDLTLPIDFVLEQDPWDSDDNTDIEYVDLHLMHQHNRPLLTGAEIRDGWLLHMNPNFIWVSNYNAWALMNRGVKPPATGMAIANQLWAFIDAQLTTEFYGAIAPGMPDQALKYADLPIRTTAAGFAAHAAQFYVVLHALAPLVPSNLSSRDKVVWLVTQSRPWIPDTSKSADIVDFVLADFLANPDPNNWELTRDRIYQRYQLNAASNGFQYYAFTESSINFATGILCLLYGQGDYKRTVQIGTLSGWDSDDPAATMGAVLGLMLGYNALVSQFPGHSFSDRYTFAATRNNLPDYLPNDPQAEDTFTLMAGRMLPLVDSAVAAAGGQVDTAHNLWVLPAPVPGPKLEANPLQIEYRRSANNRVAAAGGTVTCSSSANSSPAGVPWVYGSADPSYIGNGLEADNAGRDLQFIRSFFYSTQGSGQPPGTIQTLTVEYDRPVSVWSIRFIEGDHLTAANGFPPGSQGGWFQSASVQIKVAGQWIPANATPSEPLDPAVPFQIIDFILPAPAAATGIRISGPSGGPDGFITCAELDAIAPPPTCYANCDQSTSPPILNVLDFACFLNRFAAGDPAANCDASSAPPILNVLDFSCFLNAFAAGCS